MNKKTPQQQTNDTVKKAEALEQLLREFGYLATDKPYTNNEILDKTHLALSEFHAVLMNAGTVINHTIDVYESAAARGKLLEEVQPESPLFKGVPGWSQLKQVAAQIYPLFLRRMEWNKKTGSGSD